MKDPFSLIFKMMNLNSIITSFFGVEVNANKKLVPEPKRKVPYFELNVIFFKVRNLFGKDVQTYDCWSLVLKDWRPNSDRCLRVLASYTAVPYLQYDLNTERNCLKYENDFKIFKF